MNRLAILLLFLILLSYSSVRAVERPSFLEILSGQKEKEQKVTDLEQLYVRAADNRVRIHFIQKKDLKSKKVSKQKQYLPVSYRLYRSNNPEIGYILHQEKKVNPSGVYEFLDDNLENGKTWFYSIRAQNSSGEEIELVRGIEATPLDTRKPKKPLPLTLTEGDGQVTIHWLKNQEKDFSHYRIYRNDGSGTAYRILKEIEKRELTHMVDRDVIPGKKYLYYLTIVDMQGNESLATKEKLAMGVDKTPPSRPVELIAVAGDRQIELKFVAVKDADLAFYRIYQAEGKLTNSTKFESVGRILADDTPWMMETIKNLVNGRYYHFYVTSVDQFSNESHRSTTASAIPLDHTAPAKPGEITTIPENSMATIRFNEVEDVDGDLFAYRVYRKRGMENVWSLHKVIEPKKTRVRKREKGRLIGLFEPMEIVYTDKGLLNGVRYAYYVTAVDHKGNESKPTVPADCVPVDRFPPKVLSKPTITAGIRKITLSFTASDAADLKLYVILRGRTDVATDATPYVEVRPDKGKTITFTDYKVLPGVEYQYLVQCVDEAGNYSKPTVPVAATPYYGWQLAVSKIYEENQPLIYLYQVNPDKKVFSVSNTRDFKDYNYLKKEVAFTLPPNFKSGTTLSFQKQAEGVCIYSYTPDSLDLYYTATPDFTNWGNWELIHDDLPLPPGWTEDTVVTFEQYPDRLDGYAWSPKSEMVHYMFTRNMKDWHRWRLISRDVKLPNNYSPENQFFVSSNDRAISLYSLDEVSNSLYQSFSFDRKHFKNWYDFGGKLKIDQAKKSK